MGLGLASLAFVITSPVMRALNGALDEAATVHGIGRWRSFLHITLPLIWPALLAAAIYIAVIAVAAFEVPAVIGLGSKIYTFSTLVYIKVVPEMGTPEYGVVGAVSVVLILLSLLLSWWYFRVMRLAHRYEVVRGRSYEVKRIPLGRWRWAGQAARRRMRMLVVRLSTLAPQLSVTVTFSNQPSCGQRCSLALYHHSAVTRAKAPCGNLSSCARR